MVFEAPTAWRPQHSSSTEEEGTEQNVLLLSQACVYLTYERCKQPKDILENPIMKKIFIMYSRRVWSL